MTLAEVIEKYLDRGNRGTAYSLGDELSVIVNPRSPSSQASRTTHPLWWQHIVSGVMVQGASILAPTTSRREDYS